MKILVVEDEPKVADFIKQGLEEQNFEVDLAFDGRTGQDKALRGKYDLIVLDVNLPYISGFEVCKNIREKEVKSAVIMLTALGTTDDKIMGFDSGVDDYLVKPFEFRELLARIKAISKRASSTESQVKTLEIADLVMNLEEKTVVRSGQKILLTAKEFGLLEYFIKNRGKVVSRMDIAADVWDIHFDTGTNVIDVYVNFLRKKVDKDFPKQLIHTKVGMGYIMKEEKYLKMSEL
jgi:two-component system, OmpR family, copper resistance phosphate regulon response regulator CusR